jgi:hypothetical protein
MTPAEEGDTGEEDWRLHAMMETASTAVLTQHTHLIGDIDLPFWGMARRVGAQGQRK